MSSLKQVIGLDSGLNLYFPTAFSGWALGYDSVTFDRVPYAGYVILVPFKDCFVIYDALLLFISFASCTENAANNIYFLYCWVL